ncbi:MAG: alpha/beta fold hydrolase [Anaerolineae bacterium]|nr:alpha/beta fold hydrolase [Anaerolineae bacterium]
MTEQSSEARRRSYLEQLRRILVPSPPWESWLAESGELPPGFEAMPSCAGLPDPLLLGGSPGSGQVRTVEQWQKRRKEMRDLLTRWALGSTPLGTPSIEAEVLGERQEGRALSREVRLRFGQGQRGSLWLELLIPDGEGPHPVFMTQHNHRPWGLIALRRGYLACIYAGSDSRDDTDSFLDAFPGYDWARLRRRAWAASRCLDYLETVPEADAGRVVITGHSRNGKQSLMAAAFDDRFAAVISSSSGEGGACTARLFSSQHFGEGIELGTLRFPDWFHPRLRFFIGREHKLPMDFHYLVALCAPRPCLLSTALNDACESTWAIQQTFESARRAYRFLGAEEKLEIMWRPGGHETSPTVIEAYLDWCDGHLGRRLRRAQRRLVYPASDEATAGAVAVASSPPTPSPALGECLLLDEAHWALRRAEILAGVSWALGESPPRAAGAESAYGIEPRHTAMLLRRDEPDEGVDKHQVNFGEYVSADVFTPSGLADSGAQAPAVLWLHPFSFSHGYVAGYHHGQQVFNKLTQEGYVTFCFDQIGFGRRVEEAESFYRRHPEWSLLGKMVRDCQDALDALLGLPYVDGGGICLLGYSMGALLALHVAALDERPAATAVVCPPQPFRRDGETSETGGLSRWSRDYMLLTRLGRFVGNEAAVPYDLEHLIACNAPRPLLVVTPELDREARLSDVSAAIDRARAIYRLLGAEGNLTHAVPEDYNHLSLQVLEPVLDWMSGWAG